MFNGNLKNPSFIEAGPFYGRGLSVFNDNMALPRHRWYEFKEGFSAVLVKEAIERTKARLGKQSLDVLDPFSGSGTTLLVSLADECNVQGIEVNPFLAFAIEAKLAPGGWSSDAFERALRTLLNAPVNNVRSHLESFSTFCERPGLKKWLFNREVLRSFASKYQAAEDIDDHLKKPLKLALLASALDNSNAKRDGKCLRYRKGWKDAPFGESDFVSSLERRSREIYEDVNSMPLISSRRKSVLHRGDSREVLANLGEEASVDLVVTSPPYLNSFDYSDVYRPEMFLGGFVGSNDDLRAVRLQTVRSHVQVRWTPTESYQSQLLSDFIGKLREAGGLWDPRLPDMVQAYFDDMSTILGHLYRLTKPNGEVWFVVSTSAYAGIEIPVDEILAQIGQEAGFGLEAIHVLRRLRSSGQHWKNQGAKPPLRESLIIWQKRGG